MPDKAYGLFSVWGIEAEYMIVDSISLKVKPIADELLKKAHGSLVNEHEDGPISWSNELVMHVIEFKTNGPRSTLKGLDWDMHHAIIKAERMLETWGARILPTAMHPTFVPNLETCLWPHDSAEIYDTYNRIFNCQGHGWSNLQSVHINLPFANDQEFGSLHAAVRLVLPLIPAIAASSPLVEGGYHPWLDGRVDFYRHNQRQLPIISGDLIPEPVYTEASYRQDILAKAYEAVKPFDPHGTIQDEWLNSRAAIARFDRSAIEIRVMDIQECPTADVALCALITATLKMLCKEAFSSLDEQKHASSLALKDILLEGAECGLAGQIKDAGYLSLLGLKKKDASFSELWQHLYFRALEQYPQDLEGYSSTLASIFKSGNLAARIKKALGSKPKIDQIHGLYSKLADHLRANSLFLP